MVAPTVRTVEVMDFLSQRIARFTTSLSRATIPPGIFERAKVTLLHNLVVALAGARGSEPVLALAAADRTGGSARSLADGTGLPTELAVLVNAALMHARTQDDVHFPSQTHVGSATLPALLALGEELDAGGTDLLVAMVAGYEAVAAVAAGIAPQSTARGFRATAVYGPIASAFACARLLGLDADTTAHAAGLAAGTSGGTSQTWVAGTPEWRYQVGIAARQGLTSARLAAHGATAAPDAMEGTAGLYAAFTGTRHQGDPERLGRRWALDEVSYKPYPVCAINQVPIVTLLDLLAARPDIDEGKVDRVRLALHPDEHGYPGTDAVGPFVDVGGTLMSAQFCLAAAIRHRTVAQRHLEEFGDASLMALVERIEVVADAQLAPQTCTLELQLTDSESVVRPGSPDPEVFRFGREGAMALARRVAADEGLGDPQPLAAAVFALERSSVRALVDACLGR